MLVDAAFVVVEELAAVFDDELVRTVQGKMEALGAQRNESLVFLPTQIDIGEGTATKRLAVSTAGGILQGTIEQQSVSSLFVTLVE